MEPATQPLFDRNAITFHGSQWIFPNSKLNSTAGIETEKHFA